MASSDRRAKKDLDAARMRGDLPPEEDASGNKINPHIPEFMAKAPWYLAKDSGPSLAHQRLGKGGDQSIGALEPLFRRGETAGRATRFRAGACRNCGAATHTERDCVERPRRVGAWKSGADIAPDEVAPGVMTAGLRLGWDAKRDAYAGYDGAAHAAALEAKYAAAEEARGEVRAAEREKAERERAERKAARCAARESRRAARKAAAGGGGGGGDEAGAGAGAGTGAGAGAGASTEVAAAAAERRKRRKAAKAAAAAAATASAAAGGAGAGAPDDAATASSAGSATGDDRSDSSFSSSSEEDEKQREHTEHLGEAGAGELGSKAKMTSWNVRVREDTAKYLLNLNVDSAFYDPKTRSMRENPYEGSGKDPSQFVYGGDNAGRNTGQTVDLAKAELFAWEAYNAGGEKDDTHLQANPTQAEFLRQQVAARSAAVAALQQQRILAQYGSGGAGVAGAGGPPPELRVSATEAYREYGLDGRPLVAAAAAAAAAPAGGAAQPAIAATAREAAGSSAAEYGPEDVHPGNHASVWGSWFDRDAQVWGFACCHATLRGAYCTGRAGKRALEEQRAFVRDGAAGGGGLDGGDSGQGEGVKRARTGE